MTRLFVPSLLSVRDHSTDIAVPCVPWDPTGSLHTVTNGPSHRHVGPRDAGQTGYFKLALVSSVFV